MALSLPARVSPHLQSHRKTINMARVCPYKTGGWGRVSLKSACRKYTSLQPNSNVLSILLSNPIPRPLYVKECMATTGSLMQVVPCPTARSAILQLGSTQPAQQSTAARKCQLGYRGNHVCSTQPSLTRERPIRPLLSSLGKSLPGHQGPRFSH